MELFLFSPENNHNRGPIYQMDTIYQIYQGLPGLKALGEGDEHLRVVNSDVHIGPCWKEEGEES